MISYYTRDTDCVIEKMTNVVPTQTGTLLYTIVFCFLSLINFASYAVYKIGAGIRIGMENCGRRETEYGSFVIQTPRYITRPP